MNAQALRNLRSAEKALARFNDQMTRAANAASPAFVPQVREVRDGVLHRMDRDAVSELGTLIARMEEAA